MINKFWTFLIIFPILLLNCRKDTNPLIPEEEKDPRQYNWTADTLDYPSSSSFRLSALWGSSANDIYVVGRNGGQGLMQHFNGVEWTIVNLHSAQGGNIQGPIDLHDIYGFSSDDIWAVGEKIVYNQNPPPTLMDSSLIIHYDGNQWQEVKTKKGRLLQSVWGSSANDIWFAGLNGTVFHYNGLSVTKDSLPIFIPDDPPYLYNLSVAGNSTEDVYVLVKGWTSTFARINYLLKHQSNQWELLDSTYIDIHQIWINPSGKIFGLGDRVYVFSGDKWELFFDELNSPGIRIKGLSDDNIWVIGIQGMVLHYNGENWFEFEMLQSPANFNYFDMWTDGSEVFIVGNSSETPRKGIILHGQ